MNYEVVKVYHQDHEAFNAESSPIIRVQAFNQDYTLYLEENNGVLLGEKTPLFVADVDSSGIHWKEICKTFSTFIVQQGTVTIF